MTTTTVDMSPVPTFLDQSDIARLIGRPDVYVRASLNARGKLPAPDVLLGRQRPRPGWLPGTIDAWLTANPDLLQPGGTWVHHLHPAP